MYGLTKIAFLYKEARSIDAQNVRNYRGMLEAMSGDLEEQLLRRRGAERSGGFGQFESNIRAMQEGRQGQFSTPLAWPLIAHGTSAEAAEKILREGYDMDSSRRNLLGQGADFSTPEGARMYADSKSHGQISIIGEDGNILEHYFNPMRAPYGPQQYDKNLVKSDLLENNKNRHKNFIHGENMAQRALEQYQKNPNAPYPGMSVDPGAVIRLATPTELRGTGHRLPNSSNYRAYDIERVDPNFVKQNNLSKEDILRANQTRKNVGTTSRGWSGGKVGTGEFMQIHGVSKIKPEILRPHGVVPGYNAPVNQSPPVTNSEAAKLGKPPSQLLNKFKSWFKFK